MSSLTTTPASVGVGYSPSGPHILDMPDEILLGIFELVRGPCPKLEEDGWVDSPSTIKDTSPPDIESIRNIRLTCRRFSQTGALLLLPGILNVRFDYAPMRRLEAISSDPVFRTQIKAVKVLCSFYNETIANSAGLFADISIRILGQLFTDGDYEYRGLAGMLGPGWEALHHPSGPPPSLPELKLARNRCERLQEVKWRLPRDPDEWSTPNLTHRKTLENWLGSSEPDRDRSRALYRKRFLREHRQYRRRFRRQEKHLGNGSFIRFIASALAKMPVATTLLFYDADLPWEPDENHLYSLERLLPPDAVFGDAFVHPTLCSTFTKYREHELKSQAPKGLILTMLHEIGRAGVKLTSLGIRLHRPWSSHLMGSTTEEHKEDVMMAVSHLKRFALSLRADNEAIMPNDTPTTTFRDLLNDWKVMYAVAVEYVLSNAPHLERLSLYVGAEKYTGQLSGYYFPAGSSAPLSHPASPSTSMQHVNLAGLRMTPGDPHEFIEFIYRPACSTLTTEHTWFFDQDFAEIVDMLRDARQAHGSGLTVQFMNPLVGWSNRAGFRCTDLDDLFGVNSEWADSLADRYIRGLLDKNPVREFLWEHPS